MRTLFAAILSIVETVAAFSETGRAGWATSGGPVGPTTDHCSLITDGSTLAWGRFRRRRAWQPEDAQVLPITPPAACPRADEESDQLSVISDQKSGNRLPGFVEEDGTLNFGVDRKGHPGGERYTVDGEPASKPQAIRLIEGQTVPDDAKLVRLTAIGTPAECEALTKDLENAQELAVVKNRVVLQVYDVGNDKTAWAVKRYGFVTDGHPSIYVQAPSLGDGNAAGLATGQVLARFDHYPGPQVLAATLNGAVRKTDPTYDPKKDPDPTKPAGGLPPVPVLLIGGGIAAALLLKKQ